MTSLPPPLIPAEVDLRDFPFMPMVIGRLFGSEFHALSNDAEWRAGVTLWLKAFHQVPAASIPDDDIALARLAELGRDVKAWRKQKAGALRGWILCSDNRHYHPVVAARAMEAWIGKLVQRKRSVAGNNKQHGNNADVAAIEQQIVTCLGILEGLDPESSVLSKRTHRESRKESPREPTRTPQRTPSDVPQGPQGTETLTETVIPSSTSDTSLQGGGTRAGVVSALMRRAGLLDTNPDHPKLLALIDAGVTDAELESAAKDAASKRKGFAYALAVAEGRRRDAATVRDLPDANASQSAPRGESLEDRVRRKNGLAPAGQPGGPEGSPGRVIDGECHAAAS